MICPRTVQTGRMYMRYDRVRAGIAGFGMSGQIFHAPFLHADERYQIRKVYERTSKRAEQLYPYVETVRRNCWGMILIW